MLNGSEASRLVSVWHFGMRQGWVELELRVPASSSASDTMMGEAASD